MQTCCMRGPKAFTYVKKCGLRLAPPRSDAEAMAQESKALWQHAAAQSDIKCKGYFSESSLRIRLSDCGFIPRNEAIR